MSAAQVWWWRYATTGLWHARLLGRPRSLCGLVASTEPGQARPGGRACRKCSAGLERLTDHTCWAPAPCRCDRCREWRADHAEDFAASFRSGVCRCVEEWPPAWELVAPLEARLAGLLLAWEASGEDAAAREVEVVEGLLRRAWEEAARRYDLLDGGHPFAERLP